MTTGLREAVDGLWHLDSGDFERAVMYLTSPGNNNLFRNESKVVRILLLNQQQVLASEYMEHCASYFKSTDLVEMQLKMQLEDGGVNGAFMCQKAESEKGNMQLLTLMLNAAFQSRTSESLLTCAFSDAEEQTLVEFCDKHAHEPVCIDFLFKYYFQRGRLAEAVSWIESNRVNMNGSDVDAELIGKIENLKLVLPESQLELIRRGNQTPDEISNEDRKGVAPASHLITALLDRCVENGSSETAMEGVDMFRSAVASPVIPAPETPVGRGTGTATPNKKDHTRVASPFMKRALTPTRATEFVDFFVFCFTATVFTI
ncbi:nuclear pore complex assembly-domain-containing protein [Chytriomyces cf. hyalinus JEL632]|nr:nuclear pore complex assembly-domain-containing protein [Chytriomyces cf. hyalinus JEL632]